MAYMEQLRKAIGDEPLDYILREVCEGRFLDKEAEKFANDLHSEAKGAFINSKKDYGEEAMELILSTWYERGRVFELTKDEALLKLISALNKARKEMMAAKIKEIKEMCMESQDTTNATAGNPVVSNNPHPVHQPSASTKVVTDRPSHPHPIPSSTKASTGTSPAPSDQGSETEALLSPPDMPPSNNNPTTSTNYGLDNHSQQRVIGNEISNNKKKAECLSVPGELEIFGEKISVKWILGISILIFLGISIPLLVVFYCPRCSAATNNSEGIVTEAPTRSIRLEKGEITEFFECPTNQSNIPKFSPNGSNAVDGSVAIYTKELGILLCGGTDEGIHNPKQCYTHQLGTDFWVPFELKLNVNRVDSHIKRIGNKIIIIGGESSLHDCYNSYETLDLDNISAGWQKTETRIFNIQTQCFKLPFFTIDNIPCSSTSRLAWAGLCWAVMAVQIFLDQDGWS